MRFMVISLNSLCPQTDHSYRRWSFRSMRNKRAHTEPSGKDFLNIVAQMLVVSIFVEGVKLNFYPYAM